MDHLKRNWAMSQFRRMKEDIVEEVMAGRRQSALQSLAVRYRRFSNISLVMIAWSVYMYFNPVMPERWRFITSILFGVYFLTVSIMDYWLYRGIRSIDLAEMSMRAVILKAAFYRKRHLQFVAILLPMALALVGLLVWQFTDNTTALAGVIFGMLVGLAIGFRQLMKFLDDYRILTRDLSD